MESEHDSLYSWTRLGLSLALALIGNVGMWAVIVVLPDMQAALARSPGKVWILDDDPTGTQTIADLPVLTDWDPAILRAEFAQPDPGCFILTNSRALTTAESRTLHRRLARHLTAAAAGRP